MFKGGCRLNYPLNLTPVTVQATAAALEPAGGSTEAPGAANQQAEGETVRQSQG